MKLITLKRFDNSVQANILKTKLEHEGIVCHLHDENLVTLNPFFNETVGGIKLKISDADQEQAQMILDHIEREPIKEDHKEIIHCPNCGSKDLYNDFKSMKNTKGIIAAIVSFLLTVFPIYFKTVYRCKACGTEFK